MSRFDETLVVSADLRQEIQRSISVEHSLSKLLPGACRWWALIQQATASWSANTDPKQQDAASLQMLQSGCLRR